MIETFNDLHAFASEDGQQGAPRGAPAVTRRGHLKIDGWEFALSVGPRFGKHLAARRAREDADLTVIEQAKCVLGIPDDAMTATLPNGEMQWAWDRPKPTLEGLRTALEESGGNPCSAIIDGWEFIVLRHPMFGMRLSARPVTDTALIGTINEARRAFNIPGAISWKEIPGGMLILEWSLEDELEDAVLRAARERLVGADVASGVVDVPFEEDADDVAVVDGERSFPPTDLRANVMAFHRAMDQAIGERPAVPNETVMRLRARLLVEECLETVAAMFQLGATHAGAYSDAFNDVKVVLARIIDQAVIDVNLGKVADGLADLGYVNEGAFLAFGIDSRPVHAMVHASNMEKASGPVRPDGKRLKPPGWQKPDVEGEILRQQKAEPVVDSSDFRGVNDDVDEDDDEYADYGD